MKYLERFADGFAWGLGFVLAWRILGALISFIAGAHGGPA